MAQHDAHHKPVMVRDKPKGATKIRFRQKKILRIFRIRIKALTSKVA